jgi:TPP-dependent 2-oxoacid decarboxylase
MNGVAGAYAEQAGMIHLVGMTARNGDYSLSYNNYTLLMR